MRSAFLAGCLVALLLPLQGLAQQASVRDGQHDFDFEIGTWKTHLKRLLHPLTGSTTWVEYEGTTIVRKIWDGRANLVELEADGPGGHFEGLNLRLYNPESHQWSLNFASSRGGTLSQPTIGEFKNGRGEFFDQETFQWPSHPGSLRRVGHNGELVPFRTGFLGRWRQDLGSQLDRDGYAVKRLSPARTSSNTRDRPAARSH